MNKEKVMIVDFSIKNFRSIKDEQTVSFHADKKTDYHANNLFENSDGINLVKTCAIYGSNAAGKTNFIKALAVLRKFIIQSADLKEGDTIPFYDPNLLFESTRKAPVNFDIEFYVKKARYRYTVEFDEFSVLSEKLDLYKTARPSNIFTRESASDWRATKFGEAYKGGKRQFAFFPNNSYLSKAGGSPDAPQLIRDIYNYFRKSVITLNCNENVAVLGWNQDPAMVSVMNTFLNKVDLGIECFELEDAADDEDIQVPKGMPADIAERFKKEFSRKEYFMHSNEKGNLTRLESEEQSSGTIRLFNMLPFFIQVLMKGQVILLDEIESSYHPHIAELIIKLFNDPALNRKGAQLIFTTHELSLMSPKLMRKDQVYLVSKCKQLGTTFDSLDDFDSSLKDSSPFSKWYDEGRLGAIPRINYGEISSAIQREFH